MTLRAMMLVILSALVWSNSHAKSAYKKNLPSFLQICHRSSSHLDECVMKSVASLKPLLRDGIPELGIPQCEPMVIPEFVISQGRGAIALTSTYTNISIHGVTDFEIQDVKIDLNKDVFRVDLWIPMLRTHSNYSMEGRMLILPIQGQGEAFSNYTDVKTTCTIMGSRFEQDGDTYWHIDDFLLDFEIGSAAIRVDGLFNGDEELGQTLNEFINENWRAVSEEIKPSLREKIGGLFRTLANKIFHEYPVSQLLPE